MEKKVYNIFKKLKMLEKNESDFATLILNQPILCEPQIIKSLWNNAAFRMLVDGGTNRWLDFLQKHGVSDFAAPDTISGDFDSIKQRTRAYFESKGVTVIHTPDQDETDFTKALRCLEKQKAKNIKYVFAICENAGRLDQVLANINTLHRSRQFLPDVEVILLSSETLTWVIRPGTSTIYVPDEFITAGYRCGLVPLCGSTEVTFTGLKWNLDKQKMKVGELISTSNLYNDCEIHITCDQDLVWTTQYCEIKE